MIEKTKNLMSKLGIKGEIIEHLNVDGTHSEVIAKALNLSLDYIIKCLILKSKKGNFIAAIILGDQRLDMKKLEQISKMKKFTFASENNIKEITGYSIGGVPPIAVIKKIPAFVDKDVLKKDFVVGSAGTPFYGLKIVPAIFKKYDFIICDIHEKKGT